MSERRTGEVLAGPYRIASVAELTGVPEPTLRAWERRYGIPSPQRTPSGYRLYGAEEVEQVREMRRLCDAGMAAAEAARLLIARRTPSLDEESGTAESSGGYDELMGHILDALTRFDDEAFEKQIPKMLVSGNAVQVFERVIAPVLVEIGERWRSGELTIAQEHFASHRLGTVLRNLVRLAPGTTAAECAIFASFASEEHELGLLGFALRVSHWGVRPVFLGARTPPVAVQTAVESLSPRLVALSVSSALDPKRARELLKLYATACDGVPWILGGGGAAELEPLVEKYGGKIAPVDLDTLRPLVTQRREPGDAGPRRAR